MNFLLKIFTGKNKLLLTLFLLVVLALLSSTGFYFYKYNKVNIKFIKLEKSYTILKSNYQACKIENNVCNAQFNLLNDKYKTAVDTYKKQLNNKNRIIKFYRKQYEGCISFKKMSKPINPVVNQKRKAKKQTYNNKKIKKQEAVKEDIRDFLANQIEWIGIK